MRGRVPSKGADENGILAAAFQAPFTNWLFRFVFGFRGLRQRSGWEYIGILKEVLHGECNTVDYVGKKLIDS